MALKRMDNVGIVVESLDTAISFFTELGPELEGRAMVEDKWAGRVTGLGDQRVEIAMMRTPDGHSQLELSRFIKRAVKPLRFTHGERRQFLVRGLGTGAPLANE